MLAVYLMLMELLLFSRKKKNPVAEACVFLNQNENQNSVLVRISLLEIPLLH